MFESRPAHHKILTFSEMLVVNHQMSPDAIIVVTNQHDTKCPPNDSSSWSAGYKVGYEIGWALLEAENEKFLAEMAQVMVDMRTP